MKRIIAVAALAVLVSPALAKDTSVRGYVRSDGTYVAPSHRSSPNSTTLDNYSTRGNVNPYTGKAGTRDPFPSPAYRTEPMRPIEPLRMPSPYESQPRRPR